MPNTPTKRSPVRPNATRKKVKTADDELNMKKVEFDRLLYAMEQNPAPPGESAQSLLLRADQAQQLAREIGLTDAKQQARLQKVVAQAQEQAKAISKPSLLDRLFGPTAAPVATETAPEEDETPSSSSNGLSDPPARRSTAADLQKEQRGQIEQAISTMASQLKDETAKIHSTLKVQSKELDAMETLASDNVTQVSKVASDVKDHVRKSWSQSVGTWTMLFLILGLFAFGLVTIVMAPKKKGGACFFWCPKEETRFCRTLPNGQQECVDVEPAAEPEPVVKVEEPEEVEEEAPARMEEVVVDADGEIQHEEIVMPPSDQMREEALREYMEMENAAESKHTPPQTDDEDEEDEEEEEGEVEQEPTFNDRPFSANDVRRAASTGDIETLRGFMGAHPAFIHVGDQNGWMPLHLAIRSGREDIIRALVEAGADTEARTVDGRTAKDMALQYLGQSHPLLPLFGIEPVPPEADPVYNGSPFNVDDVYRAAVFAELEQLEGMLQVKPEWVNQQDNNRWNALHMVARAGSVEAAEVLLRLGADKNLRTVDNRRPFDIARQVHGAEHPIVALLE